jgi:hypothetical protein
MADGLEPPAEAALVPLDAERLATYWEHLSRDERFTALMYEKDDVLFILRMHLVLETLMREILAIRYPDADLLLDPLSFGTLIDVVYKSTTVPEVLRNALTGANWVRNRFAHLPIRFVLSDDIWAKFKTHLDPQYIAIIEDSIAEGRHPMPGNPEVKIDSSPCRVRWGFLLVHKGLTTMLGMAHGHPDPVKFS